jgi:putative Mg2+ transporter-C (MgtC) family protein
MSELLEIILRLSAAGAAGSAVGFNRELYNKQAGMRTQALVAIGSALVVICGDNGLTHLDIVGPEGVSRALQGIFSGVGFLGAGVILRNVSKGEVTGLTTAATIWVSAGLGVACGLGLWTLAVVATVITLLILVVGQWIEDLLLRLFKK